MPKTRKAKPHRAVFTIGHTKRSIEEFIELLQAFDVNAVVDVRQRAASRPCPQFNKARLKTSLEEAGIAYHHEPALGGHRKPGPGAAQHTALAAHPAWQAFAEQLATPEGREALDRVLTLSQTSTVALMCKELLWKRCHRQIISDALVLLHGLEVNHILDFDDEGAPIYMEHAPLVAPRVARNRVVYDGQARR